MFKFFIALILFFSFKTVHSAVFCVTSATEFHSALSTAEDNGENDLIKLQIGTYTVSEGTFEFDNSSSVTDNKDISIIGGWSGSNCSLLNDKSPILTSLHGLNSLPNLNIFPNSQTKITVENILFQLGKKVETGIGGLSGSGVGITVLSPHKIKSVRIVNNAFIGNHAAFSPSLRIGDSELVFVINNFFQQNKAEVTKNVSILSSDATGVFVANNTFRDNLALGTDGGELSGLDIEVNGTSEAHVINNIFWNNQGDDLLVSVGTGLSFVYENNIQDWNNMADFTRGLLSVDPLFEVLSLGFALQENSPMINKGSLPEDTDSQLWFLTNVDIDDRQRVVDNQVDLGAYEVSSSVIFKDGFEL